MFMLKLLAFKNFRMMLFSLSIGIDTNIYNESLLMTRAWIYK